MRFTCRALLLAMLTLHPLAARAADKPAAIDKPVAAPKPVAVSSRTGFPVPRNIRETAKIGNNLKPDALIPYKKIEATRQSLNLHIFRPPGWQPSDKRPVLVTFHGGGWQAGEPSTQYYIADFLAQRGWVGISVSYRLCNSRRPGVTPFDSVKDARSAVRFIRAHAAELGVDPDRLVTNGGSAGGHLAAAGLFHDINDEADDLAVSAMPQAMLLMYPVIDTGPQGYGHALCGENYKAISPVDRVTARLPPTLIMHGSTDTVTPYAGAKLFHERMLAAGNDCTLITGKGGHGYFTYQPEPLALAMQQVETWLKSKGWPTDLLPPAERLERTDVFTRGEGGYHTYRIPAVVTSLKGALLAITEGRKNSGSDRGDIDLVMRRSTDGGRTWSPMKLIHEEGGDEEITIGNPCPVLDRDTGIIWLMFTRNNKRILLTRTSDEGETWETPIDLTDKLARPDWYWIATGPGHGIQMKNGRLLIPTDCMTSTHPRTKHSFVIYSDDHGRTWSTGGLSSDGMNECQVVERADGSLLMSMRNYLGQGKRAFAISRDAGLSWEPSTLHDQVPCPVCEASIIRYSLASADAGRNRILHSGPALPKRMQLTIRLSYDEGETWPVSRILHETHAEYSDLVVLHGGDIGVFYERDGYRHLSFSRFNLAWLTRGKDVR